MARLPADLDELRQRNAALEDQVKRLVKTEQRLHLSQRELARQLQRLDALNRFALGAAGEREPAAILERAVHMLLSLFAYEQCAGYLVSSEAPPLLVCVHALEGRAAESAERLARASTEARPGAWPAEPLSGHAADVRAVSPEAGALLADLERVFRPTPPTDAPADDRAEVLLLPLTVAPGRVAGLLALRRLGADVSFHEELASPSDDPFLRLVGQQAGMAIANAQLLEHLTASLSELAQTQEALVRRERLAAIGELAAVVAHEIRNPLGTIFNSLSSLHRIVGTAQDGSMLLGIVQEEAERLNRIVTDLIEFARPKLPEMRMDSIERVVLDALESATTLDGARGATIRLEVEPDLPNAPCDARMLRQSVINLVTNAIQASDRPAVTVRIAVERTEGASWMRIDVKDVGEGIPAEHLDRIFEPFFTTKATGTGLGLAVVKRFVEAQRGTVSVCSTAGKGSTFTIRLPAA